jgi:hypothetical protein
MFKHWMDNPIYARLAKKDSVFVRPTLWIIGIVGTAGLVFSGWQMVSVSGLGNESSGIASAIKSGLSVIAWLLMLIAPIVVAVTGIVLTSKDINSQSYQLVKITGISNKTLARGYLLATCHRQRLLIALVAALAPTSALLIPLIENWPVALWLATPAIISGMVTTLALIVILTFAAVGLALRLKRPALEIGILLGIRLIIGLVVTFVGSAASMILAALTWRTSDDAGLYLKQYRIIQLTIIPWVNNLLLLTLAGITLWLMRDSEPTIDPKGPDHVQTLD